MDDRCGVTLVLGVVVPKPMESGESACEMVCRTLYHQKGVYYLGFLAWGVEAGTRGEGTRHAARTRSNCTIS